jgi:hypothetical protein
LPLCRTAARIPNDIRVSFTSQYAWYFRSHRTRD